MYIYICIDIYIYIFKYIYIYIKIYLFYICIYIYYIYIYIYIYVYVRIFVYTRNMGRYINILTRIYEHGLGQAMFAVPHQKERIFTKLMTSDRRLKASREGLK